jgi:hypothetical protein
MPTTPIRAYAYPSLSSAPDVPADIGALATALDTDIGAFSVAWASYTPTWTATTGTPAVGAGGSLTGVRTIIGKTCHGRVRLLLGTGPTSGTGVWTFGIPVTAQFGAGIPIGVWTYADVSAGARYNGTLVTASTLTCQPVYGDTTSVGLGLNVPVAHAVGDNLVFTFTYETT